jgi:hypothetical protein
VAQERARRRGASRQAGGSRLEVALLGDAGRASGCESVRVARGREIARHLLQVCTYRLETVVVGQAFVGVKGCQHVEPRLRASDHRDRDREVQRDHRGG